MSLGLDSLGGLALKALFLLRCKALVLLIPEVNVTVM